MLNKIIVNGYNLWIVVLVAIGTIGSAYGLAIIGSTVGQPNFYTFFDLAPQGKPGYAHTTNMIAALNGINSGGAVVGCIIQAWTSDFFGRKRTIQFGCGVLIVGGAICAGAVNMGMFLAGRCIAGIGSAILACVVPIYQAEVSTPETRGAMVAVTGIMYAVGYSLAGWLGFACYYINANSPIVTFSWRFPLAMQVVFPLIVLAGSSMIPFSPRWLLQQGRRQEALEIVKRLHRTRDSVNDDKAREEFYLMEKQFEFDRSMTTRRFEICRTKANRKRLLIAFLLMFGNQFLGVYVLSNYGVIIYGNLGLGGSIPLLLNACWNSFTLIGNTWTAMYVDRFGRRRLMLIGACGCIVSVIFICAITAQYFGTTYMPGLKAGVFFCFFFIFWWCFFIDATQYIYVSEIFPNNLRSQGVAFGIGIFYLASEVTLVAAPIALNSIQWKFYLVLIFPSAVYIVLFYLLFPETKGRTLEEIGVLFGDEAHVASHWYGITDEEREKIANEALRETEGSDAGKGDEPKPVAFHEEGSL